jgi:hypothetical protein
MPRVVIRCESPHGLLAAAVVAEAGALVSTSATARSCARRFAARRRPRQVLPTIRQLGGRLEPAPTPELAGTRSARACSSSGHFRTGWRSGAGI